jgi:hypothetical protein
MRRETLLNMTGREKLKLVCFTSIMLGSGLLFGAFFALLIAPFIPMILGGALLIGSVLVIYKLNHSKVLK